MVILDTECSFFDQVSNNTNPLVISWSHDSKCVCLPICALIDPCRKIKMVIYTITTLISIGSWHLVWCPARVRKIKTPFMIPSVLAEGKCRWTIFNSSFIYISHISPNLSLNGHCDLSKLTTSQHWLLQTLNCTSPEHITEHFEQSIYITPAV